MYGMNVSDYVDSDIKQKLRELDEEEAQKLAEIEAVDMEGGMTILIYMKRRMRLCNGYTKGRVQRILWVRRSSSR